MVQWPKHLYCRCTLDGMDVLPAGYATQDGLNGADYWLTHKGKLPENYLTKKEARKIGWKDKKGNLADVANGKIIGGDVYQNKDVLEILKTIRIVKDTELKSLVTWEQIKNEILTQQYGNFVFLKALCTMLFIQFLRLSDQKSPSLFSADDLKHNLFWREQIDRLLRYHYMEPLKLQDFADAMNISSRQTSRLFVREFGMPFVQKLMETRIEQAKIQLQYSDKTLHKVSSDCGFQNYNHFSYQNFVFLTFF